MFIKLKEKLKIKTKNELIELFIEKIAEHERKIEGHRLSEKYLHETISNQAQKLKLIAEILEKSESTIFELKLIKEILEK